MNFIDRDDIVVRGVDPERLQSIAKWLAPIFAANNWEYGMPGHGTVPTEGELVSTMLELAQYLTPENRWCGTGRIRACLDLLSSDFAMVEFYLELGTPSPLNNGSKSPTLYDNDYH